ncbi:hypothetical protein TUBRATIS_12750 [Tubulinosema ratisbonensis]|uniref:Uncharacterized protein n=1 Tax=Tubulinosema ratisbonensis TaxID=291195 RepID=A0A437AM09_9MICR|nr:hypothetical protein TUBRATIS_12750 [Tubulinosema ratisbonensis]
MIIMCIAFIKLLSCSNLDQLEDTLKILQDYDKKAKSSMDSSIDPMRVNFIKDALTSEFTFHQSQNQIPYLYSLHDNDNNYGMIYNCKESNGNSFDQNKTSNFALINGITATGPFGNEFVNMTSSNSDVQVNLNENFGSYDKVNFRLPSIESFKIAREFDEFKNKMKKEATSANNCTEFNENWIQLENSNNNNQAYRSNLMGEGVSDQNLNTLGTYENLSPRGILPSSENTNQPQKRTLEQSSESLYQPRSKKVKVIKDKKQTCKLYYQNKKIRKQIMDINFRNSNLDFLQKSAPKTFLDIKKHENDTKIDLIFYEEIQIIKVINELEKTFPIRLDKVFRHLTSKQLNVIAIAEKTKECDEALDSLQKFFLKFIYNLELRQTFIKEVDKLCLEFVFQKKSGYVKKAIKIIVFFNLILKKYAKSIKVFCVKKTTNYFVMLRSYFQPDESELCKSKLLTFFNDFLKNPNFKIVTDLFPEIQIFIDEIKARDCFKYNYKRIHLFLSIIGIKIFILRGNLQYAFKRDISNSFSHFQNSNFINFFVFEMRCFLCTYGFNFLTDKDSIKFLIFNTFISFLRILNIKDFEGVKFDDYITLDQFKYLGIPGDMKLDRDNKIKRGDGEPFFFSISITKLSFIYMYLFSKLQKRAHNKKLDPTDLEDCFKIQFFYNTTYDKKMQYLTNKLKQYLEI